jgi:prevent-host-death family protein
MKDISSTEAKTHFGALLDMAQREPVTIHKKGRAVAVMLSMQDFAAHEALKLKLLQQAIDAGMASGISDRSFEEIIAEAAANADLEETAGHA